MALSRYALSRTGVESIYQIEQENHQPSAAENPILKITWRYGSLSRCALSWTGVEPIHQIGQENHQPSTAENSNLLPHPKNHPEIWLSPDTPSLGRELCYVALQ